MSNQTTIRIDKDVRDKLAELGTKNDSFNDILKRLIEEKSEKGY